MFKDIKMVYTTYFMFFAFVSLHLHYLSVVVCQNPSSVPAVYVFGDSLVDCGNNNYLVTLNMVNYYPYGADFPGGATGRYTNGRTVPDIVGLPFPPAIKSLDLQSFRSLTGVNYASGGGGILEVSGRHFLQVISFSQQIKLFQDTIEQTLQQQFEGPEELQRYLSQSIFVVTIGNNDYINNYLLPNLYDTSKIFTPQTYASYLMKTLSPLLERLYNLGARKIAVSQIGPLGCIPRRRLKPSYQCAEDVNQLASYFNNLLPETLERLTYDLPGLMFTVVKTYDAIQDMIEYPSKYGFVDVEHPCCLAGEKQMLCTRNLLPCPNPDQHLWWDGYHPTQMAYSIIARDCYNGTTTCSPTNIVDLIRA
ncbi:GDSL esterase/lipase [Thalictrum thalictroides]|uniref:GDSL esterase/lipase n=1 Tax=Thalictrum thalictroides TaxID=46969 RepID=A0A7J6UW23_THATH|nr:GDSL esterase/lipase [Thalictrum thalictroides]